MSQTMADILAQALASIRQREAFRLNWRVIATSDGVPFDSDHEFFYLNGHDDKGKPYGKPNYPVPAIPLRVDFLSYNPGYTIHIDSLEYGGDDPQLVRLWDCWPWPMKGMPDYYVWLKP